MGFFNGLKYCSNSVLSSVRIRMPGPRKLSKNARKVASQACTLAPRVVHVDFTKVTNREVDLHGVSRLGGAERGREAGRPLFSMIDGILLEQRSGQFLGVDMFGGISACDKGI